jgi:hypothetical protein
MKTSQANVSAECATAGLQQGLRNCSGPSRAKKNGLELTRVVGAYGTQSSGHGVTRFLDEVSLSNGLIGAIAEHMLRRHPVPDPFVMVVKASILMNRVNRFVRKWKNRHLREEDDCDGLQRPEFREIANAIACFQSVLRLAMTETLTFKPG